MGMSRESVTSQLAHMEHNNHGEVLGAMKPAMNIDTALQQARLAPSYKSRRAAARYAADLRYWRDISWPSFFFALLILIIGRTSGPASEQWKVTQYNQGLYRLPMTEKETVPTWAFLVWIFASAFLLIFLEIYLVKSTALKARIIMGFNTGMAMLEGFFYTVAFTEIGKFWIGEPRPDFVARCLGSHDAQASFDDNGVIICTQDVGSNARESFPSGHSSTTFSCGVFLTAYFIWTVYFRKVDLPWRTASRQWCSKYGMMIADVGYFLCFWPIVLALFVAASRVSDHRHSPADVVSGCFLGTLFGGVLFLRLLSRDHTSLTMPLAASRLARPILGPSPSSSGAATPRSDVFQDSDDSDDNDHSNHSPRRRHSQR